MEYKNFLNNVKLSNYQIELKTFLKKTDTKAFLGFHSIVDDNILTLLLVAVTLLIKFKSNDILIVTSGININILSNKIREYKLDYTKFNFLTNNNFINIVKSNHNYTKNKIVIIDKAHYLRKIKQTNEGIIDSINMSKFVFLFTTSLLVNTINDILPVLCILNGLSLNAGKVIFNMSKVNAAVFDKLFKCKISFHRPTNSELNKIGIKIYENNLSLYMTPAEYKDYSKIESEMLPLLEAEYKSNIKHFLSDFQDKTRYISNKNKLEFIYSKIKDIKQKNIIFLNNKEDSVFFENEFLSRKINALSINNLTSLNDRRDILLKFNTSSDFNVLIISNINKEMNVLLKQVNNIFIVNPQIDYEQLIHLVDNIVLSSSMNLQKSTSNKKRLDIFTLILKKPKPSGVLSKVKRIFYSNVNSVDIWLQELNDSNKSIIKRFTKKLRHYSIHDIDNNCI